MRTPMLFEGAQLNSCVSDVESTVIKLKEEPWQRRTNA